MGSDQQNQQQFQSNYGREDPNARHSSMDVGMGRGNQQNDPFQSMSQGMNNEMNRAMDERNVMRGGRAQEFSAMGTNESNMEERILGNQGMHRRGGNNNPFGETNQGRNFSMDSRSNYGDRDKYTQQNMKGTGPNMEMDEYDDKRMLEGEFSSKFSHSGNRIEGAFQGNENYRYPDTSSFKNQSQKSGGQMAPNWNRPNTNDDRNDGPSNKA